MRRQIYRVAEHNFALIMEAQNPLWESMQAFNPFAVEAGGDDTELIFSLEVVAEVLEKPLHTIINGDPTRNDGMVDIDVAKSETGYLLNLTQPSSEETNAIFHISDNGAAAQVALSGTLPLQLQALNNSLILSYLVSGAQRKTLLFHSSTIIYEGQAYMFLGKSGTGKSTHSRMWLQAFPESIHLNDDHPIVRIHDNGEIITYGSPWSGKCPCYKNMSAPLGGIARIEQSPINEAIKLRPSEAFASIMTSCSGLQWIASVADMKSQSISKIAAQIPNLKMRCLPNTDAAIVCLDAFQALAPQKN